MHWTTQSLMGIAVIAAPQVMADDFVGFGPRTAVVQTPGSDSFQFGFWVDSADVDLDGDMDVLIAGQNGFSVLTNDGNGIFGDEVFYGQFTSDRKLIAHDFNDDGYPDIAQTVNRTQGLRIRLNLRDGTFGPAVSYFTGAAGSIPDFGIGDLDGDGDSDIAVFPWVPESVISLYINAGDGSFTLLNTIQPPIGSDGGNSFAVGDVTGDHSSDLIHISRYNNNNSDYRLTVYANDGTGIFSVHSTNTMPAASFSDHTVLADMDNDGDLDVVFGNQRAIRVSYNNGNGFFPTTTTSASVPTASQFHQISVADINGDTFLDVAAGDGQANNVTAVFCNDGMGVLQDPIIYSNEGSGAVISQAVVFANIDSNSTPDLISVSREASSSLTFLNTRFNQTNVVVPGAFSLIGPADSATDLSLPENIAGWGIEAPRFSWGQPTGFQTRYDLTVMTVNPPIVEVFSASGMQERSLVVPSGVFESGTQYQWMVTAVNSVGSTPASSIFTFTTAPGPRLCEPDLNGDGELNFFDISAFLNAFSAGCP